MWQAAFVFHWASNQSAGVSHGKDCSLVRAGLQAYWDSEKSDGNSRANNRSWTFLFSLHKVWILKNSQEVTEKFFGLSFLGDFLWVFSFNQLLTVTNIEYSLVLGETWNLGEGAFCWFFFNLTKMQWYLERCSCTREKRETNSKCSLILKQGQWKATKRNEIWDFNKITLSHWIILSQNVHIYGWNP